MSPPRLRFFRIICLAGLLPLTAEPLQAADFPGKRAAVQAHAQTPREAAKAEPADPTLDHINAVAVPEPTALFFAGVAGCVLLGVGQRLRRLKAR